MASEKKVRYDDKHMANLRMLQCMGGISVVLFLAYILEFVKGSRTLGYTLLFTGLLWAPYIIATVFFKKDPLGDAPKFIEGFGYLAVYALATFTGNGSPTYVYIIPPVFALMVYQDGKFIRNVCLAAFGVNIASIIYKVVILHEVSADNIAGYEIQVALVLLAAVISSVISFEIEAVAKHRVEVISNEKDAQEQVLVKLKKSAENIFVNITDVNTESSNISQGGEKSKFAISEIVGGTNELAETVQTQLELSSSISDLTNEMSSITDDIQEKFTSTREITERGADSMQQLSAASESSERANNTMKASVDSLVDKAHEVEDIIGMIQGITGQTTLLALNASIEAARAGEAGKGFAVVADEIKELASETQTATEKISTILQELEDKTNEASESMDILIDTNVKQKELVEQTTEVFEQISTDINEVSESINVQSEKMTRIFESNQGINDGISTLSSFSQELLANAENTKSLTDETLDGTSRISELLDGITHEVEELQNI